MVRGGEYLPVTFSEIRSTAHYFIVIPTSFSILNPVGLSFWTSQLAGSKQEELHTTKVACYNYNLVN